MHDFLPLEELVMGLSKRSPEEIVLNQSGIQELPVQQELRKPGRRPTQRLMSEDCPGQVKIIS